MEAGLKRGADDPTAAVLAAQSTHGLSSDSTRCLTLGPTTEGRMKQIMAVMRTTDCLINAVFVVIVFRGLGSGSLTAGA